MNKKITRVYAQMEYEAKTEYLNKLLDNISIVEKIKYPRLIENTPLLESYERWYQMLLDICKKNKITLNNETTSIIIPAPLTIIFAMLNLYNYSEIPYLAGPYLFGTTESFSIIASPTISENILFVYDVITRKSIKIELETSCEESK